MGFQKAGSLLKKHSNLHHIGPIIEAGKLCKKAEDLLPNTFIAISVRITNIDLQVGVMHLSLYRKNLLNLKMKEGSLLHQLNNFAKKESLPQISHFQLTFINENDIIISYSSKSSLDSL